MRIGRCVGAFAGAFAIGAPFVRDPVAGAGKRFETYSGAWTLVMYFSVGILPLVLKWWARP